MGELLFLMREVRENIDVTKKAEVQQRREIEDAKERVGVELVATVTKRSDEKGDEQENEDGERVQRKRKRHLSSKKISSG